MQVQRASKGLMPLREPFPHWSQFLRHSRQTHTHKFLLGSLCPHRPQCQAVAFPAGCCASQFLKTTLYANMCSSQAPDLNLCFIAADLFDFCPHRLLLVPQHPPTLDVASGTEWRMGEQAEPGVSLSVSREENQPEYLCPAELCVSPPRTTFMKWSPPVAPVPGGTAGFRTEYSVAPDYCWS